LLLYKHGGVVMRRVAFFAIILAVAGGCTAKREESPRVAAAGETEERSPAGDEAGAPGPEAVVIADKLRVRAEGSLQDDVVGELERGAIVKLEGKDRYDDDSGLVWAQISADTVRGWAALDFMLPLKSYEAVRPAERAAEAGDAATMVAELKKVCGAGEAGAEPPLVVAPSGKRALAELDDGGGGLTPDNVFIEVGAGLRRNFPRLVILGAARWSGDDKFAAFPEVFSFTGGNVYRLVLFDAARNDVIRLGFAPYKRGGGGEPAWAFAGGYFVWLGFDETKNHDFVPRLSALKLTTRERSVVLKADLTDVATGESALPKVKLKPAASVPADVAACELYRRFAGAYVLYGESG
jgi:hypothetical protein